MTLGLLMIGDGRDTYHDQARASVERHVGRDRFDVVVEIDDRAHELGFAGAVQRGWDALLEQDVDWIFHLELDFTFNARVPLTDMLEVLAEHPEIAQLVLKRQPWNAQERAAGGIVEQHPDDYTERTDDLGRVWTEHRRFWSTNPSVYSARWARVGWPQVPQSEGIFTHQLLRDPHLRFAFWGAPLDAPRVHHIGDERKGRGY